MKHTKTKRKKKRPSGASVPAANDSSLEKKEGGELKQQQHQQQQQQQVINLLMEAFASFSVSIDDAKSALDEANGDVNKAAEILAHFVDNSENPSVMSSVSGTGFDSGSTSSDFSEGFSETGCVQNTAKEKRFKHKRAVAATGTVSTVLGREYMKASPRNSARNKGFWNGYGSVDKAEAEQFLCSMLGNDCELSLAVVRDVLCQCGYNLEKALEALLDLFASCSEQAGNGQHLDDIVNFKLTDKASDCTSLSSESDLHDSIWSIGYGFRNYAQVLTSSEAPSPTSSECSESDIPHKVLESLFNISQRPEHEPSTMNWRKVVKKMQLLGPGVDAFPSSVAEPQRVISAKSDEYTLFRKPAKQHWDAMRSYYEKAATAYSKGKREYAAYLSDQGKLQTRFARVADEKASMDIFKARNNGIENVITIDLHGQHVKQSMRMLKQHILLVSYVPSIQTLRVITGCGSHGLGKSKLKQSVVKLVEKEGIEWSEENKGTLIMKLDGYREFSFLDSE
ncbi:Smr domain-containing protein/DUF1771 domain-containing protein [Cephalotus follicularis]|uniref:Smr domain-containing protein/DUF1771 domain-containing protein n=1 Tax=Cephalotus follicularis TaxID=3775 RepID=A0A1Q3BF13_CEPFO|nr:Smr domain-containing protein/DUF1771 domain-containing protein [Cephalotus follicularis]